MMCECVVKVGKTKKSYKFCWSR